MNKTIQTLERLALDAHRRGGSWTEFWQEHADATRQAEPYNAGRYHRLVNRLLAIVVSGDCDGQQPIGDDEAMPWELDDHQPDPANSHGARLRWPMTSKQGEIVRWIA